MSCKFADGLLASCQQICMTYAEFYSKNKFEKLVHLVGFIVRTEVSVLSLYMPNVESVFSPNSVVLIHILWYVDVIVISEMESRFLQFLECIFILSQKLPILERSWGNSTALFELFVAY